MAKYKVTFEGESYKSDDDKFVEFIKTASEGVTIPEDFMPKMFEYLESDFPYDILYQIKTIDLEPDNKSLSPDNFISIVAQFSDGNKGGLLLEDQDDTLLLRGFWNFQDFQRVINDIYSKPELFELVVLTIAESLAPE